jgi:hypothetical protein
MGCMIEGYRKKTTTISKSYNSQSEKLANSWQKEEKKKQSHLCDLRDKISTWQLKLEN